MVCNVILKNKQVKQIKFEKVYTLQEFIYSIVCFSNERHDIEHIILPSDIPINDYGIKNIKNIHFITKGEFFHYKKYGLIPILNKEQNFHLYINDPNKDIKDIQIFNPNKTNLHIIPLGIGRCYSVCKQDINLFLKLNFDINKYKLLKGFKNILWFGKKWVDRNKTLKIIEEHTNLSIKEVFIDFTNETLIDVMIENKCFCVLSLDGHVHQCFRDVEVGLSRVFNLKYTSANFDISANSGIYVARTLKECTERIDEIRNDIINENYTKLNNAYNFFKGTTNIIKLFEKRTGDQIPRGAREPLQHPFYSIQQIEILSQILSLDINQLLSSKEVHEMSTAQEWENIVNKFLSTV